jgi:ATP-binding cassette subfamily C (CFTR/MRP) protein 1
MLGANILCSSQDNPALNNISFSIKAGQKVCIVGRTGSGKSTLMSALLRLIDLQSGTTYIDGIDISTLPAETVRRNVTAIPQTPFFLPGSIASNLTLSVNNKINGLACIAALQKVGLWDLIFAQGGLEANISALSLSHGQQQLFCLARAILKKTTPGASKILIMDETTSGVDGETEELMERLLFDEFMDSTVICIAHRLKLARNCDVVVVLEGGSVVEMGEPEKLLEESGRFQGLWEAQLS